MRKISALTLKWDQEEGCAVIDFKGLDKLYGIEKVDFLTDCIDMLTEQLEKLEENPELYINDYTAR